MKRENQYFLFFALLVVVLFAFAYRDLWGSGMFAYGDLIPFPTSSSDAYELFFTAWNPKSMGSTEAEPFSTFAVGLLLSIVGNNAVLVQKVVLLSLLPVSAITMYILLGCFVKSQPARFIASFIYSVNRMTMAEFLSLSISALSVYALLPLVFLFSLKILEEEKMSRKIRNMLILTIVSSLTFANSLHIVYALLFPVMIVFFLFYFSLSSTKLRYAVKVIPLFLISFVLGHLLLQMFSPWYLGLWFPEEGVLHTLQNVPMDFQIYNLVNCYTYPPTTVANLFRLAWSEYVHGGFLWALPSSAFLGFIIPLLAFSSLVFRKHRRYSICFSITAIMIILFLWLTYLGLTHNLFRKFPILFIYRFPSKLIFTLSFVYAPMIAITIEGMLERAKGTKLVLVLKNGMRVGLISARVLPWLLLVVLIVPIALYDWPFSTGDMTLSARWGNDYAIPSAYYNATSWVNEHRESEGFFRTLWLPWDHVTSVRLWRLDPYTFSVPIGGVTYGISNFPYFKSTLYNIVSQRTSVLGTLLGPANVKYVIVDFTANTRDVPMGAGELSLGGSIDGPFALGVPDGFVSVLDDQEDLEKVADITGVSTETEIGWVDGNFSTGWTVNALQGGSSYSNTTDGDVYEISITAKESNALYYMQKNVTLNTDDYPYFMVRCKVGETGGKALVAIHYSSGPATDCVFSNRYYSTHRVSLPRGRTVSMVVLAISNTKSNVNTTYSAYYDAIYFNNDGSVGEYGNTDFVIYENKAFVPHIAVYDQAYLVVATPSDPSYSPLFPEMTYPSYVSSLASLSFIPDFDVNRQLLVFQDNLTVNELPLESYEAIVFIDKQTTIENIGSQKLVFIYEADRESVTKTGNWTLLQWASASDGHAVFFGTGGDALREFVAPRSGSYKIGLRALTDGNITIMIDDAVLQVKRVMKEKGFNWYETESLNLDFGPHQVSVTLSGESVILDQLVIFSSDRKGIFGEIFASTNSSSLVSSNRITPTAYQVNVNTEKQVFIVLGESYHPGWHAFADGEELTHLKGFFYSNAFLLSGTGENGIKIYFEEQRTRDLIIGISAAMWITLPVYLACTSKRFEKKLIHFRTKNES